MKATARLDNDNKPVMFEGEEYCVENGINQPKIYTDIDYCLDVDTAEELALNILALVDTIKSREPVVKQ